MPLRDYNDHTRMTRAQLADRIRQMEATAARNSQLGAPNDRHRPMEDRRRREKIATYRQELDRRDQYDAAQAAADARTAADFEAFKHKLETSRSEPTPPAPIGKQPTPDAGERTDAMYEDHAYNGRDYEDDPAPEATRQATRDEDRARTEETNWQPDRPAPTPEAMHPDPAHEHSPARRLAKRRAKEASRQAEATVRAVRGETQAELAELRRIVRDLVSQHSAGTVIECAWDAAHELFSPVRQREP